MSIKPGQGDDVVVEGELGFHRILGAHPEPIVDNFAIRISFPGSYPKALPVTWEIGERIPRNAEHHVNPDGDLCLGNPLRIRLAVAHHPSPANFIEMFVVPFLCGISVKSTLR